MICLNWEHAFTVLLILVHLNLIGFAYRRNFRRNVTWNIGRTPRPIKQRAAGDERCTSYCLDASACKNAKCHYDYSSMHCFRDSALAAATPISYPLNIKTEYTQCLNIAGRQHYDADGYNWLSDLGYLSLSFPSETSSWINNARSADQYVFRTQRRQTLLRYYINPLYGDGHFQIRLYFAEWESQNFFTRRSFNVVFNDRHHIVSSLNIADKVGQNSAYVVDVPFQIWSGQIHIIGQTSQKPGDLVPLTFHTIDLFKHAAVNGICGTRMYECTWYCNNQDACNQKSGCYYDLTTYHCVSKDNRGNACKKFAGKKEECQNQGCEYCCDSMTCVAPGSMGASCNFGCAQFCMDQQMCIQHGCKYNSANGTCEEKQRICEYLVHTSHDQLENCVSCTGNKCAYLKNTIPHLCVPIQRLGNFTYLEDYYTKPEHCQDDCKLHVAGLTQSLCVGCVRGSACAFKHPVCEDEPKEPECVPADFVVDNPLMPGETAVWNITECMKVCKALSNNPIRCRSSGCNFCCSTGQCYAGHETDPICPSGCGSFCYQESKCLAHGCFYDLNTNQCVDNRTACSLLDGAKDMCLELKCDYCCKKQICIPWNMTAIDIYPDHPPHLETSSDCCETSPDRFETMCTQERKGHYDTGIFACNKTGDLFTGNYVPGGCKHNSYKYKCTKNNHFWSNCRFVGKDVRSSGVAICSSIGSLFQNAFSGSTCTDGSYRFLCGNGMPNKGVQINPGLQRSKDAKHRSSVRRNRHIRSPWVDQTQEAYFHSYPIEKRTRKPLYKIIYDDTNPRNYPRRVSPEVTPRASTGCTSFCLDAGLCKRSGCIYDYRNMHCVEPSTSGLPHTINYGSEAPQSAASCRNIGGNGHFDINGYQYESDRQTDQYILYGHSYGYPSTTTVAGVDQRDSYLYLSERRSRYMRYFLVLHGGDGNFQIRFHFVELVHRARGRRLITIKVNFLHELKSSWDIFSEYGHGNAVTLDYKATVENGQLVIDGRKSILNGNRVFVEVLLVNIFSLATGQMNAICGTRMPHCTTFCNSAESCNSQPNCFYSLTLNHCLPKTYFSTACEGLAGDKTTCLQQGCQFCCNSKLCHEQIPFGSSCNVDCEAFCFEKTKCLSQNCHYIDATDICEEKVIDCAALIQGISDSREKCSACVLGECAFAITPAVSLCVGRKVPISTISNITKYYNTTASCQADSSFSNGKATECRERGDKYCCDTMTCHKQNDPAWNCTKGCSRWCLNEQLCKENKCFYMNPTSECTDIPSERPCDRCDRCGRERCEEAGCWFHSRNDTCYHELGIHKNQTSCEENDGKYCDCGIPRCIPTSQECQQPANKTECIKEKCFYDCINEKCSEKPPCYQTKIQLAFVNDGTGSFVGSRRAFAKISGDVMTSVQKKLPGSEFSYATFGDYPLSAGPSDDQFRPMSDQLSARAWVDAGCYLVRKPFTTDKGGIQSYIEGLTKNDRDSSAGTAAESSLTALLFSAADKKVGWVQSEKDPSDKKYVRKVIILTTDQPSTRYLDNPGSRTDPKGDGTDTCDDTLPPTDDIIEKTLIANNVSLIGLYTDTSFSTPVGTYPIYKYYETIFGSMDIRYTASILDFSVADQIVKNILRDIELVAGCNE